jgi:hypothetical protein
MKTTTAVVGGHHTPRMQFCSACRLRAQRHIDLQSYGYKAVAISILPAPCLGERDQINARNFSHELCRRITNNPTQRHMTHHITPHHITPTHCVTMVTALPDLPARAVRPTLWM